MIVFATSSPDALEEKLSEFTSTVTVEAEYGERVVEGTVSTLAHHGSRSDNPAPCEWENRVCSIDAIGISHFDLDTLGGIAAVLNKKPEDELFWNLAAYIDIHGAHKLVDWVTKCNHVQDHSDVQLAEKKLFAFWAWSRVNKLYVVPEVLDVTDFILEAIKVITKIVEGDEKLLAAGQEFRESEHKLNEETYKGPFFAGEFTGLVIRRESNGRFCNHLYETPDCLLTAKAVVAYDEEAGTITASLADPIPEVSCCEIMQRLFGPEAGGHSGIAGSPRGKKMQSEDVNLVLMHLNQAISLKMERCSPKLLKKLKYRYSYTLLKNGELWENGHNNYFFESKTDLVPKIDFVPPELISKLEIEKFTPVAIPGVPEMWGLKEEVDEWRKELLEKFGNEKEPDHEGVV